MCVCMGDEDAMGAFSYWGNAIAHSNGKAKAKAPVPSRNTRTPAQAAGHATVKRGSPATINTPCRTTDDQAVVSTSSPLEDDEIEYVRPMRNK